MESDSFSDAAVAALDATASVHIFPHHFVLAVWFAFSRRSYKIQGTIHICE